MKTFPRLRGARYCSGGYLVAYLRRPHYTHACACRFLGTAADKGLIGDCGFQRWSLLRDTLKSKFSVTKGTLHVAMRLADGSRLEHKFPSPTPVKVCILQGLDAAKLCSCDEQKPSVPFIGSLCLRICLWKSGASIWPISDVST